eukprot:CAMPEP_0201572748 /NCGR_PEP_ID=MMETSP0190_2-20130828/16190_1 /ASSEMBLY_ACC=CAM_ASM_000263 /TAXON_ID=37353 /ORGANISM="Rosalina sp." /LENGTH=359 /DNA_ID=CAMNT_0047998887 /DNA_START=26 /DNA_END=1102 /DNA_ORIENTATION=+
MGNSSNAESPNNDPSHGQDHVRGAAANMQKMMEDQPDNHNNRNAQVQNYTQYPPSTQQYPPQYIQPTTTNPQYVNYGGYPPQAILRQVNNQPNQPQLNNNSLPTPPQASTASNHSGSTVSVSSQGQIGQVQPHQVNAQIGINQNQLQASYTPGSSTTSQSAAVNTNALLQQLTQNPNANSSQIGQLQLQLQQQIQELQILQQKQQIEQQRIALLQQQNQLDAQRITHEAQQKELIRRHAEQQQVLQLAQQAQAQEQLRQQQLAQIQAQQAQAQAQAQQAAKQREDLQRQQQQAQIQAQQQAQAQAAKANAQQQAQANQQSQPNQPVPASTGTQDEKYPVIFRWNHGGRDVYVAYSGDNW